MTNEQEQRLEAMQGVLGDEAQFDALMERTTEIIDQSFDMFRIIAGTQGISVYQGNQPLIAFDQ